ncbi:hypothetical protein DFP72DRAFT_1113031 [Ephemerocybe angulata]|uniref:Uncharacterized protein n=1 Tax=Ephemerocybe angulata TaxID=980116 RepID=A0A8H6MAN9_9AGAR|nr:hypothetical protein DFP72DRAFT_1113031 [Tulosesus angulatus]
MSRRFHHRRQGQEAPPDAPTAAGISNTAVTVDPSAEASATDLKLDTGATSTTPPVTTDILPKTTLAPSTIPAMTTTTEAPAEPTSSLESASASSSPIAMSTVIGACVGAFVGAAAFIILGLYFYRRYSQTLKRKANMNRRAQPRSVYTDARNGRADEERRRSKLEAWNQLNDDNEDKWEGMNGASKAPVTREVKEMDNLSPDLYRKAPNDSVPEARDLLGRQPQNMLGQIDSGPPIATRLSGGAMSPTLTMAIPTPPATRSQLHRWESAEVINYAEPQSAEIVDEPVRESLHNPFFNAASDYPLHKRSRSNSSSRSPPPPTRSRSSSTSTIQPNSLQALKSKERVVSIDPFRDPLPKPSFIHHYPTHSSSSSASNDRAIRQLVAAASLDDLSEDEVQRRLRVASMQPSIVSNSGDSMYTDSEPDPVDDDSVMSNFPVPPSSSGHSSHMK